MRHKLSQVQEDERGPKPKLGEAMTAAILVKCTPALRDEMAAAAKRLDLGSIPEYLRELHSRFLKSEGPARKPRNSE